MVTWHACYNNIVLLQPFVCIRVMISFLELFVKSHVFFSFNLFLFQQSLTVVGLSSTSLVSLSLVGCRAMTVLDLSCPNLLTVNLDGCDHLEKTSFCPVSKAAIY